MHIALSVIMRNGGLGRSNGQVRRPYAMSIRHRGAPVTTEHRRCGTAR